MAATIIGRWNGEIQVVIFALHLQTHAIGCDTMHSKACCSCSGGPAVHRHLIRNVHHPHHNRITVDGDKYGMDYEKWCNLDSDDDNKDVIIKLPDYEEKYDWNILTIDPQGSSGCDATATVR